MSQNIGTTVDVIDGLGTYTRTIATANPHSIRCYTTIDNQSSALVITLNLNGTPIATSLTAGPTNRWLEVDAYAQCAIGDVITVVLTSSSAADSVPGTLQSTISVTSF